jgi:hypothetical protein
VTWFLGLGLTCVLKRSFLSLLVSTSCQGRAHMVFQVTDLFTGGPHDKVSYSWIVAVVLAAAASFISNLGVNMQVRCSPAPEWWHCLSGPTC